MIYLLRKQLLLLVIPALLCACQSQEQRRNERLVDRAATLLETAPDSTLSLLNIVDTAGLSRRYKARHKVLGVRAKDKADMDISADTAVFPVKDYLVKIKDEYAAMACFAAARVDEVQGKDDQALYNYLLATDRTTDNQLNALVCYNIGLIYFNNRLYRESLDFAKEALIHDEVSGTTGENLCFVLELIAINHCRLSETNDALIYLNKALRLAEHENTYFRLYFNIALTYHNTNVYTLATDKYQQALSFSDSAGIQRCYLGLAGTHAAMRQIDSAYFFLNKVRSAIENSEDYNSLKEMYRILSITEEKQPYKAFYRQIYRLFPVVEKDLDNSKIMQARERYKNDVIREKEAERDRIAMQRKMYFLVILNLVLVSLIGIYFFRRYLQRTQRDHRYKSYFLQYQLEKEQQRFDAEIKELQCQHEVELQRLAIGLASERKRHMEKEKEIVKAYEKEMGMIKKSGREDRLQLLLLIRDLDRLYEQAVNPTGEKSVQAMIKDILRSLGWEVVYPILNNAFDGLLDRFREDLTMLNEKEYQACCISYAGFDKHIISAILDEDDGTSKNRLVKVRRKLGIKETGGSICEFLNARYGIVV